MRFAPGSRGRRLRRPHEATVGGAGAASTNEPGSHGDTLAPRWRTLTAVLAILLLLVVAHDVDHVVNERRLGELSAAFWAFLPVQYGAFLGILALVWRRRPPAPTLVAALAAASVFALVGAHLVPFGPLPYADGDPLAISWALVFVPMVIAVVALTLALRLRSAGRRPNQELGPG